MWSSFPSRHAPLEEARRPDSSTTDDHTGTALSEEMLHSVFGMRKSEWTRSATALLAIIAACSALAHEAPRLVLDLPAAGGKALRLPKEGHPTLEAIRSDPAASDLRIGLAAPDAVRDARALSLDLAPPAGSGKAATASFYALKVEERSERDYSLHAYDEASGSEVSLVVMGSDVLGTIRHDGEVYRVRPLGGGLTVVYRYDTGRLPGCGVSGESFWTKARERREAVAAAARQQRDQGGGGPDSPASLSEPGSGEVMDVLVAYTPQARRAAGNIHALIRLFVEDTNRFYANSRILPRIRLVHSHETEYRQESEMLIDLNRVSAPDDTYMDEVHARRDEHGADLVALLVADYTDAVCGIAHQYIGYPGADAWGFSVSAQNCGSHTFAHELGHNQGAHHDPVAGTNQSFPYGHGLCNSRQRWRTVMAYRESGNCRPEAPHFSNPDVSYRGTPTGDEGVHNNARVINETAHVVAGFRRTWPPPHIIPLVMPADNAARQGFVRIINRSPRAGRVRIHAVDDAGRRSGPVYLSLDARASAHFNSEDLEEGNPSKGLSAGVGDGDGSWRLELSTGLDIEPRAYVRTSDGFLTSIHQTAAQSEEGDMRHLVPIFNPGSNRNQESRLRVINMSESGARIVIRGLDDRGDAPPKGIVRLNLPAKAARMLSARQLEEGDDSFSGRLGDGSGKWQLFVSADRPIQVMNLLYSRLTGNLTNLSR